MLLRSTKLLAAYHSNHTLYHLSSRVTRSVSDDSCPKGSAMEATSTPYSMTFVSIDDQEKAVKLAHQLLENKLAACVQIMPKGISVYRWEGKVQQDNEVYLMIKSRQSRLKDLTDFVVANHPYKVSEVVSFPVSTVVIIDSCKKSIIVYNLHSLCLDHSWKPSLPGMARKRSSRCRPKSVRLQFVIKPTMLHYLFIIKAFQSNHNNKDMKDTLIEFSRLSSMIEEGKCCENEKGYSR